MKHKIIVITFLLLCIATFVAMSYNDVLIGWYLTFAIIPIFFSVFSIVLSIVNFIRYKKNAKAYLFQSILFFMIAYKATYLYYNILVFLLFFVCITIYTFKNRTNHIVRHSLFPLLVILSLQLLIGDTTIQKLKKNTVNYWTRDGLEVSDFTFVDKMPSRIIPNSNASIATEYYIFINRFYNYPNAVIITYQYPNLSYFLKSVDESSYSKILNHEQLHFDIKELYRDSILKSINRNFYKSYEYKNEIIDFYAIKIRETNRLYDSSIIHSDNRKIEQKLWDDKIRNKINN